jgi:malate synthase A
MTPLCEHRVNIIAGHGITVEYGYRTAPFHLRADFPHRSPGPDRQPPIVQYGAVIAVGADRAAVIARLVFLSTISTPCGAAIVVRRPAARAQRLDAGERPDFLPHTAHIRDGDWKIAPIPQALACRRVEITGPVERKMVINALNSGADSYMTDFEDSNTPNWDNQLTGQLNLMDAVRRTISLEQNGKQYRLTDKVATLVVRPRGWHLDEKHILVDGRRVGGGVVDFALFMTHNAHELLARGAGPTSTCRRWNRTWKHACGTISSC